MALILHENKVYSGLSAYITFYIFVSRRCYISTTSKVESNIKRKQVSNVQKKSSYIQHHAKMLCGRTHLESLNLFSDNASTGLAWKTERGQTHVCVLVPSHVLFCNLYHRELTSREQKNVVELSIYHLRFTDGNQTMQHLSGLSFDLVQPSPNGISLNK